MEIKDSATYPYPIWGLNDDYLGPEPDGIPTMSRDSVTNEFVFSSCKSEREGIRPPDDHSSYLYK